MARQQCDSASRPRSELGPTQPRRYAWPMIAGVEPSLEEILADPIMELLWRRDHLPPARARATIQTLQALLRRTSRTEPAPVGFGGGRVSVSRSSVAA